MPNPDERPTLLIVDDEERLRRSLQRSLGGGEFRTLAAGSGDEALELLTDHHVDLVITDLVMPGMDGLTLVKKIKELTPEAKFIIITAYGSAEGMQEAKALGVAEYLTKPFDLSHLRSKVRQLLRVGGACQAPYRALRALGTAVGKTTALVSGLPGRVACCVKPRGFVLAVGKLAACVSAVFVGIQEVASRLMKMR